jgi:high-affinity nickel-transport protein
MPSTISAISVVTLGFVLGMRHATDADHVVAVATIVSQQRRVKSAAWIGALWGLGHTVTILAVGLPIVLFDWAVGPRVGLMMELGVGLMLIWLGLRNLQGRGWRVTSDLHGHAVTAPRDRAFGGLGFCQGARPVAIGFVHGLAGSAAVALLVLTTIRDPTWAAAYLIVFGLGTVAGMVLITTAIALPFATARPPSAATRRRLRLVTGLLSFSFGLFLAYQAGVVNGVFSAAPRWIPQ